MRSMLMTTIAAALVVASHGGAVAESGGNAEAGLICFQNGRVILALDVVTDFEIQETPSGRRYVGRWVRSTYAAPEPFRIDAGSDTTCFSHRPERGFFFSSGAGR